MADKGYLQQVNSGVVRGADEEIQMLEKQLSYVNDSIFFYEKELNAHKKLRDLFEKNGIKKLESEYNYQDFQEYWDLQLELTMIQKDRQINTVEVELSKAREAKDKLEAKIASLKGD